MTQTMIVETPASQLCCERRLIDWYGAWNYWFALVSEYNATAVTAQTTLTSNI